MEFQKPRFQLLHFGLHHNLADVRRNQMIGLRQIFKDVRAEFGTELVGKHINDRDASISVLGEFTDEPAPERRILIGIDGTSDIPFPRLDRDQFDQVKIKVAFLAVLGEHFTGDLAERLAEGIGQTCVKHVFHEEFLFLFETLSLSILLIECVTCVIRNTNEMR